MVAEMDVQEAVRAAKEYITTLYADEGVSRVGLEEVKFEGELPGTWDVTIGFFRSFSDQPLAPLAAALHTDPRRRVYKIVRIDDENGQVISVTHRAIGDGE